MIISENQFIKMQELIRFALDKNTTKEMIEEKMKELGITYNTIKQFDTYYQWIIFAANSVWETEF